MTWTSIPEDELAAAIRALQQEHAADHPAPHEEPTRTADLRKSRASR